MLIYSGFIFDIYFIDTNWNSSSKSALRLHNSFETVAQIDSHYYAA